MKKTKNLVFMLFVFLFMLLVIPADVEAAGKVKINRTKTTIYTGETTTLKVSGTKKKVRWTTTNKKVATVSCKGKVTGKKAGTATITAKVSGKSYKCKVTVKKPYLNKSKVTLTRGKTFTLKLTGAVAKKYTSSNKAVATVTGKGKITAKKPGTATITCTAGNSKKYTCKVTVKTEEQHIWDSGKITKAANCMSEGIKTYTCLVCGKTRTETVKASGVHALEWVVDKAASRQKAQSSDDFGCRHQECIVCHEKGITEQIINIGDKMVYGCFDEEASEQLINGVNRIRLSLMSLITVEIVDLGNGLRVNEKLNQSAMIRAAELTQNYSHDGKVTQRELIATGQNNEEGALAKWREENLYEILRDQQDIAGAAGFWFDVDGSGENLVPFWVVTIDWEETYDAKGQDFDDIFIENDETGIPDKVFYEYLLQSYDTNQDGRLSKAEAYRITTIRLYNSGVKSISGIENLSNLCGIWLEGNEISDLSPLQRLKAPLRMLWMANNQIDNLNPLKTLNLETCVCDFSGNKIEHLEFAEGKTIQSLYVDDNQITSLKGINHSDISVLFVQNNQLKTLEGLYNSKIQSLNISGNQLTSLNGMEQLDGECLDSFVADDNQITTLEPLKKLGTLMCHYFSMENNRLTSFQEILDVVGVHEDGDTSVDFSNNCLTGKVPGTFLKRYKSIDLTYNQITGVEATDFYTEKLDLSHNKIKSLDHLTSCAATLRLSYNEIDDLSELANKRGKVTTLYLDHNQISDVSPLRDCTGIEKLDLTYNKITSLVSWKDGAFMGYLQERAETDNGTSIFRRHMNLCGEYPEKDYTFALGNTITLDEAKLILPEEFYLLPYYEYGWHGEISRSYLKTPLRWIDTEYFVGNDFNEANNGLVYQELLDKWLYYKDGHVQTLYRGIAENAYGKCYVDYGCAIFNYQEVYGKEYYQLPDKSQCWKIKEDGYVDADYNGPYQVTSLYEWSTNNPTQIYYLKNGCTDTDFTGNARYVERGETCVRYIYFENGFFSDKYRYDFIEEKEGRLYYFERGIAQDYPYTGTMCDDNGVIRCYEEGIQAGDGPIKLSVSGEESDNKYYWFEGGVAKYIYTGVVVSNYADSEKSRPIFITDGVFDPTIQGLYVQDKEPYYFQDGQANVYNGVVGQDGDVWVMEMGCRNTNATGAFWFEDHYVYIENGTLDKTYQGAAAVVEFGNLGTLVVTDEVVFVSGGVLDTTFDGIYATRPFDTLEILKYKNGTWDGSFSGFISYENQDYYITDGKLSNTQKGFYEKENGQIWAIGTDGLPMTECDGGIYAWYITNTGSTNVFPYQFVKGLDVEMLAAYYVSNGMVDVTKNDVIETRDIYNNPITVTIENGKVVKEERK